MVDVILTILGVSVFLPFIIACARADWTKANWDKELFLMGLVLALSAALYIPSVMYIASGLFFAMAIPRMIRRPQWQFNTFAILAVLYIGWFAISLTWSAAPKKGVQFLIDNGLPFLIIALISCTCSFSKADMQRVLRLFCDSACIFVGLALFTWVVSMIETHTWPWEWPMLTKQSIHGQDVSRWVFRFLGGVQHGYNHPSYCLLPVFTATAVATWLRKQGLLPKGLWTFLWGGSVLIALATQSRMGLIYAGILWIGYCIYMLPNLRARFIAVALMAAFGFTAYAITEEFWHNYGSDRIRNHLSEYTWRYIKAKPWSGAGCGALNAVEMSHTIGVNEWPRVGYIAPDAKVSDWKYKAHMLPHNQWLADWSHAGIVAFLLSVSLYVAVIVRSIRKRSYWAASFMLIFCIFSYLEPPLYIGKGLYLFLLLVCMLFMNNPANATTVPIQSEQ